MISDIAVDDGIDAIGDCTAFFANGMISVVCREKQG
jgi:hypothetical protein